MRRHRTAVLFPLLCVLLSCTADGFSDDRGGDPCGAGSSGGFGCTPPSWQWPTGLSQEEIATIRKLQEPIEAAKAWLRSAELSPRQRDELAKSINESEIALALFIDGRMRSGLRMEGLQGLLLAGVAMTANDATVVGVADNVAAVPLVIAAVLTVLVTVTPADSREEVALGRLTRSLERLKHSAETTLAARRPSAPRPAPETATKTATDIVPVPRTKEDDDRPERCRPQPVPHKGKDPIHDACADAVPPNVFPGQDVLNNGKHFDALDPRGRLWEVRTANWSGWRGHPEFLHGREFERYVAEVLRERDLAAACGYPFVLAVADPVLFELLEDELVGQVHVIHVPQCRRQVKP